MYEAVSLYPVEKFPDRTAVVEALQRKEVTLRLNQAAQAQKAAQTAPASFYKAFIYQHESGNNPLARNSTGCLGLGQACPGSKLLAVCPDLADYACQDAFFTRYMLSRYGSWEAAYQHWLTKNWW